MNTREQGDYGERSAIEWLWSRACPVFVPVGHSPDIDLVTVWNGRTVGVQVKTATYRRAGRWCVLVATRGGNQSWSGVAKNFSSDRCDYLFVLVGDGRRWFMPSECVDATTGIMLGGPKYRPFEVERGAPIPGCAAA